VAVAHSDGANTRVGVALHVPNGGLGPVRDLSPAGVNAGSPLIAVDRQGNATVVYGDAGGIETRLRPAGGDWGAVIGLPGASPGDLSLAVGDNGAAVLAWWANTGTGLQTQAAVRAPHGTTFAGPLPLSVDGSGARCPGTAVAMDAAGDAAAIWTRRTPDGHYIVETATKAVGSPSFAPGGRRGALGGQRLLALQRGDRDDPGRPRRGDVGRLGRGRRRRERRLRGSQCAVRLRRVERRRERRRDCRLGGRVQRQ
jgi:hypothetical protein